MPQDISLEDIQRDEEAKSETLRQLYLAFQKEMEQIEDDQEKLLIDMIKLKQNHE